jgi:alkylation response protein AidB-like acyl-CoA dehydrogenase
VDFEPTEDQRAITEAVSRIVRARAGAKRARELLTAGAYDHELAAALKDAGFVGVAAAAGALGAVLALEEIARQGALVAYGASALVAPGIGRELASPLAVAVAGDHGPVRYGAHARTLLVVGEGPARVRPLAPGDARPVGSSFAFPLAHVPQDGGEALDDATSMRVCAWWRVAVAAEIVGTASAALDLTLAHVKERHQFGRPIGAFQALQHRLAECTVLLEGSRWLARESAWLGAPPEQAELAATHAAATAKRVFQEAHQMHGAMGLTREHDLYLWSTRLPVLWVELAASGTRS